MKISIITPNYNYAKYIGQTIESILNQAYQNFEHIIVDDGSTDNSVQIIKKYQIRFPNKIKLIQQENRGQTAAINVGLKKASGDIVAWINSDDTFCDDTFSQVVNAFKKKPKATIVFGDMNVMDMEGNFIYRRRHLDFSYLTGCFLGFTTILSSNAIFWRSEVMKKKDLLEESLKCNMDGEYYSRLTQNEKVVRIKAPLANFRKQAFTKAAENNPNWDKLVKKEVSYELENSYKTLLISKYVPYNNHLPIKYFFRLKRIFFRILNLHFVKQYFEKRYYLKNSK